MSQITITITKGEAMDEAMRTSAYLGAKTQDVAEYDRKALIDHDKDELGRYWRESRALASSSLSEWLVSEEDGDDYIIVLSPSLSWNGALLPSVKSSLRGFLANSMLAKWLMVVDPSAVQGTAALAASLLADVERALCRLKRPERRV